MICRAFRPGHGVEAQWDGELKRRVEIIFKGSFKIRFGGAGTAETTTGKLKFILVAKCVTDVQVHKDRSR